MIPQMALAWAAPAPLGPVPDTPPAGGPPVGGDGGFARLVQADPPVAATPASGVAPQAEQQTAPGPAPLPGEPANAPPPDAAFPDVLTVEVTPPDVSAGLAPPPDATIGQDEEEAQVDTVPGAGAMSVAGPVVPPVTQGLLPVARWNLQAGAAQATATGSIQADQAAPSALVWPGTAATHEPLPPPSRDGPGETSHLPQAAAPLPDGQGSATAAERTAQPRSAPVALPPGQGANAAVPAGGHRFAASSPSQPSAAGLQAAPAQAQPDREPHQPTPPQTAARAVQSSAKAPVASFSQSATLARGATAGPARIPAAAAQPQVSAGRPAQTPGEVASLTSAVIAGLPSAGAGRPDGAVASAVAPPDLAARQGQGSAQATSAPKVTIPTAPTVRPTISPAGATVLAAFAAQGTPITPEEATAPSPVIATRETAATARNGNGPSRRAANGPGRDHVTVRIHRATGRARLACGNRR